MKGLRVSRITSSNKLSCLLHKELFRNYNLNSIMPAATVSDQYYRTTAKYKIYFKIVTHIIRMSFFVVVTVISKIMYNRIQFIQFGYTFDSTWLKFYNPRSTDETNSSLFKFN